MTDFARGKVLGDVDVLYRKCGRCGLVAAADPDWLDRAYSDVIVALDVGRLRRCLALSNITAAVLRTMGGRGMPCLDWAGGYGILTRLMRDRGYDFRHYEPMARNVFAQGFTADLDSERYGLVTAIEVLEHLPDPVADLSPVAASTDVLLATTEPLPTPTPKPGDWWYYSPDTGQHITFYTPESLRQLGYRLNYDVLCGSFVHLFYRGKVSARARMIVKSPKIGNLLGAVISPLDRRHGKTESDTEQLARQIRAKRR